MGEIHYFLNKHRSFFWVNPQGFNDFSIFHIELFAYFSFQVLYFLISFFSFVGFILFWPLDLLKKLCLTFNNWTSGVHFFRTKWMQKKSIFWMHHAFVYPTSIHLEIKSLELLYIYHGQETLVFCRHINKHV